jgi:hypothetical protein
MVPVDEHVSVIEAESTPSGTAIETRPEENQVFRVDSGGEIIKPVTVRGAVPAWLSPGLNIFYMSVENTAVLGTLGKTVTFQYEYEPRYFQ